jgi:hypothetical protein
MQFLSQRSQQQQFKKIIIKTSCLQVPSRCFKIPEPMEAKRESESKVRSSRHALGSESGLALYEEGFGALVQ